MNEQKYPRGMDALPEELEECYASLFQTEHERLIGKDIYDVIFDHSILFPLQRRRETAYMMQKARQLSPAVVMEIGTDKGGGLYHWCKGLPTVKRVIACEIRGTPYSSLFEKAFPHLDFLWLPKSSYDNDTLLEVSSWLAGDKIDCLFLDGDKSCFDRDFFCYLSMVNPQGLVFFHDIQDGPPGEAFRRVIRKTSYDHTEFIDITESREAVDRQSEDIPAVTVHEHWLRHWKGRSAGLGVIRLGEVLL